MLSASNVQYTGKDVNRSGLSKTKHRTRISRKKAIGTGLFTRRAYARTYCQAHIVFITTHGKIIHKGVMYNYSPGGMYIETVRYLPPGTGITVKLRQSPLSAKQSGNERISQFRGKVVWCRVREDNYPDLFGAGVQFEGTGFSATADRLTKGVER